MISSLAICGWLMLAKPKKKFRVPTSRTSAPCSHIFLISEKYAQVLCINTGLRSLSGLLARWCSFPQRAVPEHAHERNHLIQGIYSVLGSVPSGTGTIVLRCFLLSPPSCHRQPRFPQDVQEHCKVLQDQPCGKRNPR